MTVIISYVNLRDINSSKMRDRERDVLVSVHQSWMRPGKSRDNAADLEMRFPLERVFHSGNHWVPTRGVYSIPDSSDVDRVYVSGCYAGACIDAQTNWLIGRDYKEIFGHCP